MSPKKSVSLKIDKVTKPGRLFSVNNSERIPNFTNGKNHRRNNKSPLREFEISSDNNHWKDSGTFISPEYIDLEIISKSEANHYCPYCKSDKWKWIQTLPVTTELLCLFLIQEFKCEKCRKKFIDARRAHAVIVRSVNKCYTCQNPNLKKVSRSDSSIHLYQCKKCLSYMGIKKY